MKKVDCLVALWMVVSCSFTAIGGNIPNHRCATHVMDKCNDSPDVVCKSNAENGGCGGGCEWCDSAVGLTDTVCWPEEGIICYDRGATFNCGKVAKHKGTCSGQDPGEPAAACICDNVSVQGDCDKLQFACVGDDPM